jgi:ubiquinone/menaquinone biosynthesis C-methylase UbiE
MKYFLVLALSATACAQDKHPVTHRAIAPVMTADGADWLERPERQAEEHPRQAIEALHIAPGSTVADVGAGSGYISRLLAQKVGASGMVYCSDIQPRMIELLRGNMADAHITNYRAVVGTDTDPKLPAARIDLILMADVYHEFAHPREMLQRMREALKPGGRLVLLEYRKEDPEVPIREEHKMSVKTVRLEIEPEGFQFDQAIETLPRQHILIFRKPAI